MILLLALVGCISTDELPHLGACASYPSGIYEYGEIGIGTCIAAPASLTWVGDGSTLAIANTNAFRDFRTGSVLTLDFANIDLSIGRNLVSDLDANALEVPNFSGSASYAAPYETLLLASRDSEGERTREATDPVFFVDLANVNAPSFSTDMGPDNEGGAIELGYDMNDVVYDATTDRAWSIQRTSHKISTIDLASRPVRVVPPGGDGRLVGDDFLDLDLSGSRADFSVLELGVGTELRADAWTATWAAATVRAWVPTPLGAYRITGNGESTWVRSGIPSEIDLADVEGAVAEVRDPAFVLGESGFGRMVFSDEGNIRAADEIGDGQTWAFESDPLLAATDDEPVLRDPFLVLGSDGWFLYYAVEIDGISSIYLATSADGFNFTRRGTVVAIEGESATDPSVLYDSQVGRWRMWFSQTGGDGLPLLAQASSDDLAIWTVSPVLSATSFQSPTVGYWSGAFHMFSTPADGAGAVSVVEASSFDGYEWTDLGPRFVAEDPTLAADGIAIQFADESAFRLTNLDGDVFTVAVSPGLKVTSPVEGWVLEAVAGYFAGPSDSPTLGAFGLSASSRQGDVVWLDLIGDDGLRRIGRADLTLSGLDIDSEPALQPKDEGFTVDGVGNAVVAQLDSGWVMYFSGTEADVTSIGRATSADGLVWDMDAEPLYSGIESWESVEVSPGSVQVLDDGSIRLWYTGTDGEDAKIGLLESTDGGESFQPIAGDPYPWIFDSEAPGSWDDSGVRDPFVVTIDGIDHMWFSGSNGDSWQVGYATRASDDETWLAATDPDGEPRPVLPLLSGSIGALGVSRPVVTVSGDQFTMLYTAIDSDATRVGLAQGREADRLHRKLKLPTLADEWGFTVVPPNEDDAISLDFAVDDLAYSGRGCTTLELDSNLGMLFVGCKLVPYVFVLDVRDDSTTSFDDLNYLGIETVLSIVTSTGSDSGIRDLVADPGRGVLWGIADEPDGIYAIRIDDVVDDARTEVLRDRILGILTLPAGLERDEGVDSQASVGPAQIAMHPDGEHLFVTNFNDNSLSVYDLSIGPIGTLVGTADAIGENPYGLALTPDGLYAVVANYSGEVGVDVSSTLVVIDADPASSSFLSALTWVVNR